MSEKQARNRLRWYAFVCCLNLLHMNRQLLIKLAKEKRWTKQTNEARALRVPQVLQKVCLFMTNDVELLNQAGISLPQAEPVEEIEDVDE